MTPYKYTRVGDKVIFHYHHSDIKEWMQRKGGLILTAWEGDVIVHKGFYDLFFGKTERIVTYKTKSNPIFDGEYSFNPERIINPPTETGMEYALLIPQGKLLDSGNIEIPKYFF